MNGDTMRAESLDAIRAAQAGGGVHVSPMTAWEIATLAARGRLALTRPPEIWFGTLVALPGVRLAPLTPAILIASASLPGAALRDPVDRMMVATARALGHVLITRDAAIIGVAEAGHLTALAC